MKNTTTDKISLNSPSESKNLTSLQSMDDVEVDVEPVEQEERLAMVRQNVVDGIRKMKTESGKRLLDIWSDINKNTDINEFIRQNMQTNQLHIQEAQTKYWERKRVNEQLIDAYQEKLLDGDSDALMAYHAELERVDAEERRDHLYISNLMKSSTTFAKEYRQCATQRKSSVDIGQVLKLKAVFLSAIHNNVHDQATLEAISAEILQGCLELLPVSSETDLGA